MKSVCQIAFILSLNLLSLLSFSQKAADPELKKPQKYENRKLGSEKSAGKKFTVVRRATQNTFTHYNYFFNANLRLNDVVNRAKSSYKDDYSQLLSFYNYSLDATAQEKSELDSVIYKCTAGILLHDLRNDWIDNMYLIMAKAYFFRKDLDSAGMTLQYLNFAFAPKEKGGYDIPIGSNASNEQGEFSISTKEKNSIWNKLTGRPPSRNESFIWQVRNSIEKDELPEAAGVIEILRHDPNFPKRLKTDLNEAISYWFYKQQVYDSSAYYLAAALQEADGKQEQARWEFLIGQMYQLANQPEKAIEYYDRSINHTHNPVMDVYARLNSIHINRDPNKTNFLQQNIDELLKMARKDKYENYRDIIYYAAAKIEVELKDYPAAQGLLLRSIKYSSINPAQRSASFLLLADLNFNNRDYILSSNYYDSTDLNVLPLQEDRDRALLRKPPLKTIVENILIINKEDSLQALAQLPAAQRDAIIKKKARELRKAQGLSDEDNPTGSNPAVMQQTANLFGTGTTEKNTDFYFYNASSKASGFNEFRSRWGQRPNVDNWRRQSGIVSKSATTPDVQDNKSGSIPSAAGADISVESLTGAIPLTPEKLAASDKSIMDALFSTAQTFMVKLEEYPAAIQAYEELLRRFPGSKYNEEAMFNLIYCYQKTGDRDKSDTFRKQLLGSANGGKWAQLLKSATGGKKDGVNDVATKKYEEIYNLFIEGKFNEARTEKRKADSTYGKNFWTPQLLYIESIYYVKTKEDTMAITILNNITNMYVGTPIAEKAKTMVDVVKHRREIEDYLTKLEVTRAEDKTSKPVVTNTIITNVPPVTIPKEVKNDSVSKLIVQSEPLKKADSIRPAPVVLKNFSIVATDAQYVVVLLDKVDEVYASEAKNAFNRYNREKFYNQKIEQSSLKLDDRYQLVLQGPFTDANAAVTYIDNIKPIAGSRILPWLKGDKYSFIVISAANLDVLKTSKDMAAYRQLLQQAFPGKF